MGWADALGGASPAQTTKAGTSGSAGDERGLQCGGGVAHQTDQLLAGLWCQMLVHGRRPGPNMTMMEIHRTAGLMSDGHVGALERDKTTSHRHATVGQPHDAGTSATTRRWLRVFARDGDMEHGKTTSEARVRRDDVRRVHRTFDMQICELSALPRGRRSRQSTRRASTGVPARHGQRRECDAPLVGLRGPHWSPQVKWAYTYIFATFPRPKMAWPTRSSTWSSTWSTPRRRSVSTQACFDWSRAGLPGRCA